MRFNWLYRVSAVMALAACAGCAGGSSWGAKPAGIAAAPSPQLNKPPGPVKQFAAKVSESSVGKSVSSAFTLASDKKPRTPAPSLDDPTSLNTRIKPATADYHVSVAKIQEQTGNIEAARESYNRALSLDAQHLGALLGQARLLDRQGQLVRATKMYQQAAQAHPEEAAAYNDLGLCFARQKKFAEAADALSRAIELKPDRSLYRNNMATVLVELGLIDEATEHLTLVHGGAVAHYNVGFLLHRRGQTREALQQFRLSAQADPSRADAQEWVESLTAELSSEGNYVETAPPIMEMEDFDSMEPEGPNFASQDDESIEEIPLGPVEGSRDLRPSDPNATQPINDLRSPRARTIPLRGSPSDDNDPARAISNQVSSESPVELLPPVTPQRIPRSRY